MAADAGRQVDTTAQFSSFVPCRRLHWRPVAQIYHIISYTTT